MSTPKSLITSRYQNQPATIPSLLLVPLGSVDPDTTEGQQWVASYVEKARAGCAGVILDRESPTPENDLKIIEWAAAQFRPLALPMRWYQPFALPEFGKIGTMRDDNAPAYAALRDRMRAIARALPHDIGVAPSLYRTGIDDQVDRLSRHVQTWRIVRDCFADDRIRPLVCHRAATAPDYADCPQVPPAEFRSMLELGNALYGHCDWFTAAPDTDRSWSDAAVNDPYLRVYLDVAGLTGVAA